MMKISLPCVVAVFLIPFNGPAQTRIVNVAIDGAKLAGAAVADGAAVGGRDDHGWAEAGCRSPGATARCGARRHGGSTVQREHYSFPMQ
jgi:hypothetical protein